MYEATIRLQQEKRCVLSHLAREFGSLDVDIEELHDGKVTFVLQSGDDTDDYYRYLEDRDRLLNLERLDSDSVLVTKPSCGAYSAVYGNHGILRRRNTISHSQRVYNVLAFKRDHLTSMIDDFRDIGTVTLSTLTEFGSDQPELTSRQREVIETALHKGYFEWPRGITAEELGSELDISRATCLEHLRKAEEALLTKLLADDARPSRSYY